MSTERSLVRKLAEVLAEIERVPKRGKNEFHNYDYVTEPDLVDAVRSKLAKRRVFVFSSVEELTREGSLTTAKVRYTFADGESGETFDVVYYGQGDDKGDKGAYKAYTGALKYFLMKNFLVATGDDPEADTETDKRASGRGGAQKPERQTSTQRDTQARRKAAAEARQSDSLTVHGGALTQPQIKRLFAIGTKAGVSVKDVLRTAYRKGVDDLTREEYDAICEAMQAGETAKFVRVQIYHRAMEMGYDNDSLKAELIAAAGHDSLQKATLEELAALDARLTDKVPETVPA